MVHINYYVDYTTEVVIIYEDKVLLRKHDKYNIWLSVGGHIDPQEDPNRAAIREVKEEVGLDVKLYCPTYVSNIKNDKYEELIPPMFINRHKINDTHEHVSLTYFAMAKTDKLKLIGGAEESEDVRWLTQDEFDNLEGNIGDGMRNYVKLAFELLGKR